MNINDISLKGKVAIITGAAGGIGRAMSLALAKAGADIVATDLRAKENEDTAAQVIQLGQRALAIAADVTDSSQVEHMVKGAVSEFGNIDVLINNAGPGRAVVRKELYPQKALWEVTDEEWHSALDLTLTSAFYCCRAVARYMIERKKGKVINIASGFGLRAVRYEYTYCTGKGGLIQLTKVLALTWAKDGINVNCIAPGFIGVRHSYTDEERQLIEAQGRFVPVGRAGAPEDIAHVAVFLASEASDYMTGEVVSVDGGALADGYAPGGFVGVSSV
jgi:NAD(P)-dependent dehydrogenase (short-subunit alcohol dehydrogenase family)